MMRSPRIGSPNKGKAQRSYLDKGLTKEQIARRNFLKGRLFDDNDDGDDNFSGYGPLNDSEEFLKSPQADSDKRGRKKNLRATKSLSPSPLIRKRLGSGKSKRREASRSRSPHTEPRRRSIFIDDDEAVESYTSLNDFEELRPNSEEETSRGRRKKRMSMSLSPKQIGRKLLDQTRSRSRKKERENSRSRSPVPAKPRRSRSFGVLSRRKTRSLDGLDVMRQSLMDDKAQLDKIEFENQSTTDEGTLLERAARRVVERRRKLNRARTDGDQMERMQR